MGKQTVKTVLLEYHRRIPFPWSLKKIEKAGLDPTQLFLDLGESLSKCSDIASPTGKDVIKSIEILRQAAYEPD